MKKRILYLILSLTLAVCMLPGVAFAADEAAEVTELTEVYTETCIPETDLPSNDELFAGYVEQQFSPWGGAGAYGVSAGNHLSGVNKELYEYLKTEIEAIAKGDRASAIISITVEELESFGMKTSWTNEELGVDSIDDIVARSAFMAQYQFTAVLEALLHDCPYELYWYDKTVGASCPFRMAKSGRSINGVTYWTSARITEFKVQFFVAAAYGSGYTADTAKTGAASAAAANAKAVVTTNAAKSDYDKLVAYRDYICNAVDYNHAAADKSWTGGYGDPWQLIYVFDGKSDTKVVCEGYSKAFQYLCDLSAFNSDVQCYTVTGYMDGGTGAGGHMWNIVTMGDGNNYLVDVTNSDSGSIGQNGGLFLAGSTKKSQMEMTLKYSDNTTETIVLDGYCFEAGGTNVGFYYDYDLIWGTDVTTLAASDYDPNAEPESNIVASGICGAQGDNLTWTLDKDGLLTISGTGAMADYSGSMNPDYLDYTVKTVDIGSGVTSIGDYAFAWCDTLTYVAVHADVKEIGDWAFAHCTALTDITLPASVTDIGEFAFSGCDALTSISFPDSVETIGAWALYECGSLSEVSIGKNLSNLGQGVFYDSGALTEITVDAGNSVYKALGGVLFTKDGAKLILYPAMKSGNDYTVPDDVTVIDEFSFRLCQNLTSVMIPKSVTEIGMLAFAGCEKLSEVIFSGNAPTIFSNSFVATTATTYYPANNATWTPSVRDNYGGTLTWTPWTCDTFGKKHTPVTDPAVEPDCTNTGLTEGSHCGTCGKVLVAQTVRTAKGHSYANPVFTWADDLSAATVSISCHCGDSKEAECELTWNDSTVGSLTVTATAVIEDVTYTDSRTIAAEVKDGTVTIRVPVAAAGMKVIAAVYDTYGRMIGCEVRELSSETVSMNLGNGSIRIFFTDMGCCPIEALMKLA